jgi:hypothetical protein
MLHNAKRTYLWVVLGLIHCFILCVAFLLVVCLAGLLVHRVVDLLRARGGGPGTAHRLIDRVVLVMALPVVSVPAIPSPARAQGQRYLRVC